jgi:hypothetical protein
MAYKRMTIRIENDGNLTVSEQKQLANKAEQLIDGTGIGGYIVGCSGWTWLEWEGGVNNVSDVVLTFLDDANIASYEVIEDKVVDTQDFGGNWRSHTGDDTHATLP